MTSQKIAIGLVAVALFAGVVTAHAADFSVGYQALQRRDYKTALRIFRQLANQDHPYAQLNLGFMYDRGLRVTQDYKEAVRWYRKAADQGNATAQHNLGVMYSKGQGVRQDRVRAYMWYDLAAARGKSYAERDRDRVGALMSDRQIAAAQRLVRYWKPNAAGVRWYHKAADQGNTEAQFNLGYMYWKGLGVRQDYVKAHMWYNLAASEGHRDARKHRDRVAAQMTPSQITKAKRRARPWKPKRR